MATYPAFDTDTGNGDSPAEFANVVKPYLELLRNLNMGAVAPSNRANGDVWTIDTDITDLKHFLREDGVDVALLIKHLCRVNLDFAKFQAVRMVLEKLAVGSLPTPGAAEVGRIAFDTTNELIKFFTASKTYTAARLEEGVNLLDERAELTTDTVEGPTTNPAKATRDGVSGYLFAATNEDIQLVGRLPTHYKDGADFTLQLAQALEAGETASDVIEWGGEWLRLLPGTGKLDDAGTALATQSTDIGSDVTAKTVHLSTITIPGATFVSGDDFRLQLNRVTVGGAGKVGNVFLYRATWLYPVKFGYSA